MTIENSLERIASALEAIAKSKTCSEVTSTTGTETVKTETQRTRPGKKVEVIEEPTRPEDAPEVIEEAIDKPGTPMPWPDLNNKLFEMLGEVRKAKGQEEAKAVCAQLMEKYSGGKRFSASVVNPARYGDLLLDIEDRLEALNG